MAKQKTCSLEEQRYKKYQRHLQNEIVQLVVPLDLEKGLFRFFEDTSDDYMIDAKYRGDDSYRECLESYAEPLKSGIYGVRIVSLHRHDTGYIVLGGILSNKSELQDAGSEWCKYYFEKARKTRDERERNIYLEQELYYRNLLEVKLPDVQIISRSVKKEYTCEPNESRLVGARIKGIRMLQHCPKSELALKIGESEDDVDNVENGLVELTIEKLFRYATALHVKPEELITGRIIDLMSLKEQSVIDAYRKLTSEQKMLVDKMLEV
ncbi:MAG: helix-turn-helix transcriptional regulator [Butyrivibrio sp.]|uniref:helix-turn-helix domain-containing protein n=1 Tax=Butyrivibrio sp. TaxID=28121 RepID=UPI001B42F177|nr:helix-turn-helix transcriptional regulator [Butyrivibrio sp.]MBP3783874.1 helix-turn-helix transcriptional regulator [Butyrivibrio sp.]